jgi:hypothetical protein
MKRGVGRSDRRYRWGIVPALFALFCQIVAAGVMPMAAFAAAGPDEFAASICHAGGSEAPGSRHHQPADCSLCPICQGLALGGFVTPDPAMPELPCLISSTVQVPAPSHSAYRHAVTAAAPRGPPSVLSLAC